MRKTAELNIVKTTTQPNGHIIDWVPIESQGKIASPPPLPATPHNTTPTSTGKQDDRVTLRPIPLLELEGAQRGPGGTVPILRQNLNQLIPNQTLTQRLSKPPLPQTNDGQPITAAAQFPHWYCSTTQKVSNNGGQGSFSMFNPAVQNPADFSLLQTAVIRNNV